MVFLPVVVHEVTGLVVKERRAEAVAAALQRLMSDVTLRDKMALSARERVVAKFSVESTLAAYERVYVS
jgi:glycosyltransferase involved in cell wall biosynthesis